MKSRVKPLLKGRERRNACACMGRTLTGIQLRRLTDCSISLVRIRIPVTQYTWPIARESMWWKDPIFRFPWYFATAFRCFYFEMTMSLSLGKSRLPWPFRGKKEIYGESTIRETVSGIVASLESGQAVQDSFYLSYFLLLANTIASATIPALDSYLLVY